MAMEDSYRQGNLPMGTQLISFDFASHTMENLGYLCLDDKTPTDEEMQQVNKVFEANQKISAPVFDYCKGGAECKAFLLSNRKFQDTLAKRFGTDFSKIIKQGPAIIDFKDNNEAEQIMRAHPSRDAVSVFRPLGKSAEWDNGLFKLYTASHHQTDEEFELTQEKDAHSMTVSTKQCLFVEGALHVHLSPKGGIRMVWQGFSTLPMAMDIENPKALSFMKI